MANTIKQYKNTIFAGAGLFSVLLTVLVLAGIVSLPNFVNAANPESVSVTATIGEWLSFSVSTNTADLGNLVDTSGNLFIGAATSVLTAGSNSSGGFSVSIKGTNAGLSGSNGGLIATPASGATTTCTTTGDGTDAYGAQGVSATMTVVSPFNNATSTDIVGSLASTTAQTFLTSSYASSTKTATLSIKASANKYDKDGTYTDSVDLTLLATP